VGAWHRHVTLCLLAHAYLEVARAGPPDATEAASADGGKGEAAISCR
jgi:hypothetical protein